MSYDIIEATNTLLDDKNVALFYGSLSVFILYILYIVNDSLLYSVNLSVSIGFVVDIIQISMPLGVIIVSAIFSIVYILHKKSEEYIKEIVNKDNRFNRYIIFTSKKNGDDKDSIIIDKKLLGDQDFNQELISYVKHKFVQEAIHNILKRKIICDSIFVFLIIFIFITFLWYVPIKYIGLTLYNHNTDSTFPFSLSMLFDPSNNKHAKILYTSIFMLAIINIVYTFTTYFLRRTSNHKVFDLIEQPLMYGGILFNSPYINLNESITINNDFICSILVPECFEMDDSIIAYYIITNNYSYIVIYRSHNNKVETTILVNKKFKHNIIDKIINYNNKAK